ncbi:MAG TPA: SDR family NAD(P)-dependent oxidoreductase [Pedomonas sp.]|uniref:SDR family NAD(P)-dependent oxidoreductase n=1 Tax=Pedomonas sp. TaxID=2976421 RepID=UPI002F42CA48
MSEVALVTGGTRGIGKAAAIELARRGFAVAVTGRTRKEGDGRLNSGAQAVTVPRSLDTTVHEIEALGGEAVGIRWTHIGPDLH